MVFYKLLHEKLVFSMLCLKSLCSLFIYNSSVIIIIIIIYSLELFTSALADGFSLKSEWQQVPSNLQDSS